MTGARARSLDKSRAFKRSHPASAQAVSTAAQSRSHGVKSSDGKPCGDTAGLATEAHVRSSSEVSAFQAETACWSGIRTRNPMSDSHLLYQRSYPLCFRRPESNRCLRGFIPDALHELHPDVFARRNTKPNNRPAPVGISASPNPWPKRRSALIDQTSFGCKSEFANFFKRQSAETLLSHVA